MAHDAPLRLADGRALAVEPGEDGLAVVVNDAVGAALLIPWAVVRRLELQLAEHRIEHAVRAYHPPEAPR